MRAVFALFILLATAMPASAADPSVQDDSAAIVRHFAKPEKPVAPFPDGKFEPRPGETVTLIGGGNVLAMDEHGFFELGLHRAFPDRNLKIRNIAWYADTVYRQQRPLYFYTEKGDTRPGSVPDQRQRIEPGILMLRFGRMESLDGPESLPKFIAAYRSLLEKLESLSKRIVLVAPEPFFPAGPAGELAERRNEVLAAYTAAIRELAEERGLLFAGLPDPSSGGKAADLSRNGIDLTAEGHRWVAANLASQLGFPEKAEAAGASEDEKLRRAIVRKNRLWHQYYRPTNWAFLFGDRQHVPSSRDYRDANRRWFVEEINRLPSLIAEAEAEITGRLAE